MKEEIIKDLANYFTDEDDVFQNLLDDVIADALRMSNRSKTDSNIKILKSNIKKSVKEIFKQRGTEGVKSNSIAGESNVYTQVMEEMERDIVKQNKRLVA